MNFKRSSIITVKVLTVLLPLLALNLACSKKKTPTPTPTNNTTNNKLPSVSSITIVTITDSQANCTAKINTEGNSMLTGVGICWDVNPEPTLLRNISNNGAGIGTFTATMTGLRSGQVYYARAYATNLTGTAYGPQTTFTTPSVWTSAGSGISNSLLRALAVKGSTLYVASEQGIYRSIDQGTNWFAFSNGLNSWQPTTSLHFHDSLNLFAGVYGEGIYKLLGVTWIKSSAGLNNLNVRAMASFSNSLYAATDGGVFVSENSGNSWSARNSGLTNLYVRALAVKGSELYAGTDEGVFKSTDRGLNWQPLNGGLPGMDIRSMTVSGNRVFVSVFGHGVFVSDNGLYWTPANTNISDLDVVSLSSYNGKVFAGSVKSNIYVLDPTSTSWMVTKPASATSAIRALASDGIHVFAATYGSGLYKYPLK